MALMVAVLAFTLFSFVVLGVDILGIIVVVLCLAAIGLALARPQG